MATNTKPKMKTRQYLVDEKGQRTAIILPIEEYDALVEALEDFEDLQAAEAAKAEGGAIPWEEVKEELAKKRCVS